MQFVGRAWDDAKMLGFGYALEQQLGGAGHLAPVDGAAAGVRQGHARPGRRQVPATLR